MRHVVITPVHNEVEQLPEFLESMVAQTAPPDLWLIIDDGSNDGSRALLEVAAAAHRWISVVDSPLARERSLGSKIARLVLWAEEQFAGPWDFLSKIDADLILPPDYFESVLARFETNPKLGIASGVCVIDVEGERKLEAIPRDHTRGPLKTYSRRCWQAIEGIPPTHGWDGIDGFRAQRKGFETRHFPELEVLHRRPTGSVGGRTRGKFRAGRFAHFMGYHPVFMVARALRRSVEKPFVVGGAAMLAGYLYGVASREPVFDEPETVRFLRTKQLRMLGLRWLALPVVDDEPDRNTGEASSS